MDLEYKHILLRSSVEKMIADGESIYFNFMLKTSSSNVGEYVGVNYIEDGEKNNVVTGLTSNSHIERFIISKTTTDITKKYKLGGTYYVDGVSANESLEGVRVVYYINKIRYEYRIVEDKTIFFLYHSVYDQNNYYANNIYVDGDLGKLTNKQYNETLFIERENTQLRDKIDIFRNINSVYELKTIIGGNFFKFE